MPSFGGYRTAFGSHARPPHFYRRNFPLKPYYSCCHTGSLVHYVADSEVELLC